MPVNRQAVIKVENVSKEYAFGKQTLLALKDIDLTVFRGEFLALAGPSGSGKSTLLNLIGCIDTPSSGTISIDGDKIADKTPNQLADLRASKIGFVFQTFNLLPVLTAFENVEYPLLRFRVNRARRRERVNRYLRLVGVDKFAKQRPNQLSGGQRQRVAIARALITGPRIILADEPTANLDHRTGDSILKLMKQLNTETDTTFVFSTHDPRVMEMAGRIIKLHDGGIIHSDEKAA